MNYKSQLKGWAVDRVIEAQKAGIVKVGSMDALRLAALDLMAFAYQGDEDFNDTVQRIAGLLRENPEEAVEKIDRLTLELAVVREDIERQMNFRSAANESRN
jgi:hypothetical protein